MILVIPGFEKKSAGLQIPAAKKQRFIDGNNRPLEIFLTSETTPATGGGSPTTTIYLSLYPGTVGGVYPKVSGHFLWEMPSNGNGGFLEYPRQAITLPTEGSILNVWLKVRCLAGVVVEVVCETGGTVPTNTVEYAYVLLGFIRPDGSVVQQTYGPLAYQLVFLLYGSPSQPFGHTFTYAP
jgi:hypothetical protein